MEPTQRSQGIRRVRHELRAREVRVAQVQPLGESMVAIRFTGEALADFVSESFDDHVKLMFTTATGEPVRRDYTPRAFDRAARELTIEFALHATGDASDWARSAHVGQMAVIGGPKGSMIIPTDYAWHVLVGDLSALPAMRRRVEELPAGAKVWLVIQAEAGADRLEFAGVAQPQVTWVSSADALIAAVQALPLPDHEGFIWCAGESSVMRRLRSVLVDDMQYPKEAQRVVAYWKAGAADFHERIED